MILSKREIVKNLNSRGGSLSTDGMYIYIKDECVDTLDRFVEKLLNDLGCNFDVVYADDPDLGKLIIYKCKKCGTVIFSYYDTDDHYTFCPICSKLECVDEYWTKEDIDKDPKKQKYLKYKEAIYKECQSYLKRFNDRGGLHDYEIFKKRLFNNVVITLLCNNVIKKDFRNLCLELSFKDSRGYTNFYIHTPLYYIKKIIKNIKKRN